MAMLPLRPAAASAAGVVGTGTPESCTDAALDAALASGGLVTFDCGPAPVTIDISTGTGTKTITADTTIDGGSLITISGGNAVLVFEVNAGINFTVRNISIANGFAGDCTGGGAIRNSGGTVNISNSTFSGNMVFAGCGSFCICGNGGAISSSGTLTVTNWIGWRSGELRS